MILLFENYKRAQALIKQNFDNLNSENIDYIDNIIKNVKSGYIGNLTNLYIEDILNGGDNINKLDFIIDNINTVQLSKTIDRYNSIQDLYKEIYVKKIVTVLNKIKNKLGIKLDIHKIANILYNRGITIENININIETSNISNIRPKNEEDFIKILSGELIKHKDWKILYEDNNYLIYEILSYEGALSLAHKNQCINSRENWDNYKNAKVRFINIINKLDIEKSICLDVRKNLTYGYNYYSLFKWNNKCIDVNINNLLDPEILSQLSDKEGLEIFVDKVEDKI